MDREDSVHRVFLNELEALSRHRIGYLAHFPNAPLDLDDPDVNRLIEALAFFSARTRDVARRGVVDVTARLFRQHFGHWLDPVPASVRVEAMPKRGFADIVHVPRGTALYLTKSAERALGTRAVELSFQTTAPVTVLPLQITRVSAFPASSGRGLRIAVTIESPHRRNDKLDTLDLDLDHLGDFHASSLLRYALRRSLERASIVYDEEPRRDAIGMPIHVSFGARELDLPDLRLHDTPISHVRAFLQNPWVELRLALSLPPAPRNWRSFTLYFDVDGTWPSELALRHDSFRLNTVTVVNLRREIARTIEVDGTRDRHRIQHNDARSGCVPCSVVGVYRFTKDGLSPLRSATIAPGPGSYEIHAEGRAEDRELWLEFDLPEAIEHGEKVAVEVCWHQPVFRHEGTVGFDARLADRFLSNVEWRCVGEVAPDAEPISAASAEQLLRLVAMRGQKVLHLDDIHFLLDVLGVARTRYFGALRDALTAVEAHQQPYGKSAGGLKWIYKVTFRGLDLVALPRLDMFAPRLLELLESWSEEEIVELEVIVPEFDLRETYVTPSSRSASAP